MKKLFTLIAAAALSLSAASAQGQGPVTVRDALRENPSMAPTSPLAQGASRARRELDLKTGEHIMGYYTTDDLPSTSYGLVENPGTGYRAATVFETQVTRKFVGGRMTGFRYAIADETPIYGHFVCEVEPDYNLLDGYDPLVEVIYDEPVVNIGWNEVTLDEPIEIKADKYYVIGYIYDQTYGNYPLLTDLELETDYSSKYGYFVYGDVSSKYGLDWYYYEFGQLCIQAVVEGGNFGDYDVSITKGSTDKYAQAGGEIGFSMRICNYGLKDIDSYALNVEIDGEIVATLDTPIGLTGSYQTLEGSVALPSGMSGGTDVHSIKVYVDMINGEKPTEYTDDDSFEGTFRVYTEAVERNYHLIEQFTSVYCGWCPSGGQVLQKLIDGNPGKYAWVALHGSMMGADPYILSGESDIEYFLDATSVGYPSAAFNRLRLNDNDLNPNGYMSIGTGYTGSTQDIAAMLIDDAVDAAYSSLPAFLAVDIETDYDEGTRALNITVSGNGVEFARDILAGNVLTVYLVEDGLVGFQEDYVDGNTQEYVHNNVLRRFVSAYYGDDIKWDGDTSYSNSYRLTLDGDWDPANMRVVAFVSGPLAEWVGGTGYFADKDGAYVNNCNMKDILPEGEAGIRDAGIPGEAPGETARYAIDGRRISTPARGLNIIRMSDGSVRKALSK